MGSGQDVPLGWQVKQRQLVAGVNLEVQNLVQMNQVSVTPSPQPSPPLWERVAQRVG
jgi:hypothetical protein